MWRIELNELYYGEGAHTQMSLNNNNMKGYFSNKVDTLFRLDDDEGATFINNPEKFKNDEKKLKELAELLKPQLKESKDGTFCAVIFKTLNMVHIYQSVQDTFGHNSGEYVCSLRSNWETYRPPKDIIFEFVYHNEKTLILFNLYHGSLSLLTTDGKLVHTDKDDDKFITGFSWMGLPKDTLGPGENKHEYFCLNVWWWQPVDATSFYKLSDFLNTPNYEPLIFVIDDENPEQTICKVGENKVILYDDHFEYDIKEFYDNFHTVWLDIQRERYLKDKQKYGDAQSGSISLVKWPELVDQVKDQTINWRARRVDDLWQSEFDLQNEDGSGFETHKVSGYHTRFNPNETYTNLSKTNLSSVEFEKLEKRIHEIEGRIYNLLYNRKIKNSRNTK